MFSVAQGKLAWISDLEFERDFKGYIPFRRGNWQQADLKAEQRAAAVYLYELDWKMPVGGGKWESPHSLDIPLIFDNVHGSSSMVGDTPEAQIVADQMSAAWVSFARTGDPNCPAIPR